MAQHNPTLHHRSNPTEQWDCSLCSGSPFSNWEAAQIQSSVVRLRATTCCKSTGVDAQPKAHAPVLFTQHIFLQERSLPASLNLKDKQPNLHSKNVRLPPQRTEQKRAGDEPVFSCAVGLRDSFWVCFANEAPKMSLLWLRVGFERQKQLCGFMSRRHQRHRQVPAEHKSVVHCKCHHQ